MAKHKLHLPEDLTRFISAGRNLEYDPNMLSAGKVYLKKLSSLKITRVRASTESSPLPQGIIDPYKELGWRYVTDAIDLISGCEASFNSHGMLMWLPELKCYGAFDPDHETLLLFMSATWSAILQDPLRYLSQLEYPSSDVSECFLWLHLPCTDETESSGIYIYPYVDRCTLHEEELREKVFKMTDDLLALQTAYPDAYAEELVNRFPCRGVPYADGKCFACASCEQEELDWINEIYGMEAKAKPIKIKMNKAGWYTCKNCEKTTRVVDSQLIKRDGKMFLFNPLIVCDCRTKLEVVNINDEVTRTI